MTIQELGSIGELIAGVATVVMLAYLALQIRGNTIATRAEARRNYRSDTSQTTRLVASDADVARILMDGLTDPGKLEPIEAFRFRFLLADYVSAIESAWKEWQMGSADEEEVLTIIMSTKTLLLTPGGRHWWQQNRSLFKMGFCDYLESQIVLG